MKTSTTERGRPPKFRVHWALFTSVLLLVCALLTLHAATSATPEAASSPTTGRIDGVPAAVLTGQPVIDARKKVPVTIGPRRHTVALTFDDGLDSSWATQLIELLDRYRVHATFFITGAHATLDPGLVREIIAHGNEVGIQLSASVDLRSGGSLRTDLELRAADLAMANAGVSTSLVRLPYSSRVGSIDNELWAAITRIGTENRLVAMSTMDIRSSEQPDITGISSDSRYGEVLVGREGTGTPLRLNRLIPELQATGWQLGTLSDTAGIRHTTAPAALRARIAGYLLASAASAADWFNSALQVVMLLLTGIAIVRTALLLLSAGMYANRERRSPPEPASTCPVSVIVPAYNEESCIEATVRSIAASLHPVHIVVVDDGSADRTADIVSALDLPNLDLIRQANAGKAIAVKTGLAETTTEIVVMVDGDTILEPGTISALVRRFSDPELGAVSGNVKVGNRTGLLGQWQHIEYVIGFGLDRRFYDVSRCMPTVPGAIGAFRRKAISSAGGMPADTLAEDTDLTMAVERTGWRVAYEHKAIAWTEAPHSMRQLWKQRYRWTYGTLQAVWKHRRSVFERGAGGKLGRRGLPYLVLFQTLMPLLSPVIDLVTLFGIVTNISKATTVTTWLLFLLVQLLPSIVAFRLDHERLTALLVLPLQQFVYRQLQYLVVFQSVATIVAGVSLPWHKLERHGQ